MYDDHDRVIYVQLLLLSRHVVASLDKAFYDNYLCLVASNKQANLLGRS